MKKYQVKVEIINGANKGAIIIAELFAKHEDGAQYRTHTLLSENTEYNLISIKEVENHVL